MKILLLTDFKNRYLQKRNRFESLDVEKLVSGIDGEVEVMQINDAINQQKKADIVVYCTSQVELYKDYIEDAMFFYQDCLMIPAYEVVKSHENKFFQELYNKNYKIPNNIKSWNIGTLADFEKIYERGELPQKFVVKGKNGSHSHNVSIVDNKEDAIASILKYNKLVVEAFNNQTPAEYDIYPTENSYHRQMVIQEYIEFGNFDYRVTVLGDKLFINKRYAHEETGFTSQEGTKKDLLAEVDESLLDYAEEIRQKIKSPFGIYDIVTSKTGYHLLEWSGIHLGIAALFEATRYFRLENGEYKTYYVDKLDIEAEFATAINYYINKNK